MPTETVSIPTSLCAPMDSEARGLELGHRSARGRSLAPQEGMFITPDARRLQVVVSCVEEYFRLWQQNDAFRRVTYMRGRRQLSDRLHAAFVAEPLEDGMTHPAEHIIAETLGSEDQDDVLEWLGTLCLGSTGPTFAASVFLCVARQSEIGTSNWRAKLVRNGLEVNDVEIRDAAAQAAELWGDPAVRDVLTAHSEAVPWLRDYIRSVVDDLAR